MSVKGSPTVVAFVRSEVMRATGMRYEDLMRQLESLDDKALRDLGRLIRDLKAEGESKARNARMRPF